MMKWEAYEGGTGEPDDGFADRRCAGCASAAPSISAFTLISSKHGWRLHRTHSGETLCREWYCPSCWAVRKTFVDEPSEGRPRSDTAPRSEVGLRMHPGRSTGSLDMTSTICRLLGTKLRSSTAHGPALDRLIRALAEIELEASTWSATTGTPERRKEVWAELRALDARADALISGK